MIEAFFSGLIGIFVWPAFLFMIVGMAIGFVVGLLPGLGGAVTLALMIPFIYGMEAIEGFAFLLGMHSVVSTTGDITSILFGVPGEGTAAATIVDGHPMAKKGEAGRALGAALFSSLIGAVIGAFALAASIPVIQPLVLALGSPELFMLTLLGVTFIASLSSGSLIRGLISGLFGFWLATVGMNNEMSIPRYTMGQVYLFDGLSLVPVTIGLFAIPEIIDLAVRGTSIAEARFGKLAGVWEGVKDTVRFMGLTVRASLIGTFIGIIPGMGGSVAQWVAYGHAVQSSKDKSRFGEGAVEGVLGPGAANNSKEGGSLIPTVAFGVPGSLSTAILLGAFLIMDLEPGPDMLSKHLDVTFSLVWIIVVANIITVAVSFLFLDQLAKITLIRGSLVIPFLLVLIFLGSFATNNDFSDILVMLLFGILGYLMVLCRWARPPLILGLVLGGLSERYLFITVQRYRADWLAFPGVIIILLLMIAALFYPLVGPAIQKRLAERRKRKELESEA
jgi:TctA family transporter